MEWLGGLNFILMLVSVMPQVSGCFGLSVSVSQSVAFSPMVARMQEAAARQAGRIYLAITAFSMLLYWLAGLPLGMAINQGFMTMSTSGGDALLIFPAMTAWPWKPSVPSPCSWPAVISCSTGRAGNGAISRDSSRMRSFAGLPGGPGGRRARRVFHLWRFGVYDGWDNLRYGFFQVLSFSSTSGFASASYQDWPEFDKYVLFALAFVGGCIGSATGGLRVMRFIVAFLRWRLGNARAGCIRIWSFP